MESKSTTSGSKTKGVITFLGGFFVVAALMMPAAREADQPVPDLAGLDAAFAEAYRAGNYAKALELARQRNEAVETRHTEALYDIARMQCLLGRKDETYETLQHAADAGFWDSFRMRKDDAFASIKDEERFKGIVRAIWARSYIAMLERPERDEFQKPQQVMDALAFKLGERVADVGAGSGYFTVRVAKAVGPNGSVLAIDISQEMLDYLDTRVKKEKLQNVRLLKVPKDDPQLPSAGVDTILLIDTLHYVQKRSEYAKKLRAGLAPGGRLVVIDYIPKSMEERPWGPLPEQQISRETVDAEMAAGGLKVVKSYAFLPEQYFVVYTAE
jgi:ubiquinone/menaquinone biosynthesis C-methylase UbiE